MIRVLPQRTYLFVGVFLCLLLSVAQPTTVHATIVWDGTINTTGSVAGPPYQIPAEHAHVEGENAYYSFTTFVVEAGNTGEFEIPEGVRRVFVRVTGSGAAEIRGAVSFSRGVDFFLLAPDGVVLAEAGSLTNGGHLALTAATSVDLSGETSFPAGSAVGPFGGGQPVVFNFQDISGSVTVSGATINSAYDVLLLGGYSTTLDQGAAVNAGAATQVVITAMGDLGTVGWTPGGASATFTGGVVEIIENSAISLTGADAMIHGGTLDLNTATVDQHGNGPVGILSLAGNVIGLVQTELISRHEVEASGRIILNAENSISITHSSRLDSEGGAPGANVSLTAKTRIDVDDSALEARAAGGDDTSGVVSIQAPQVELDNAAVTASTTVGGTGGNIVVFGEDVALNNNSFFDAYRDDSIGGPEISVTAMGTLSVTDGDVSASVTFAARQDNGPGGTIRFTADDFQVTDVNVGLYNFDVEEPGATLIQADTISMNGGGMSAVLMGAPSGSHSGTIDMRADNITLSSSGLITHAAGGDGGRIELLATGQIQLTGGTIRSESTSGDSEGVVIKGERVLLQAYKIESLSDTGDAGPITLDAVDQLLVDDVSRLLLASDGNAAGNIRSLAGNVIGFQSSTVTVSVGSAAHGTGGVVIDAPVVLFHNSTISATAGANDEEGPGPSVTVDGDTITMRSASSLDTCSPIESASGDINLNAGRSLVFAAGGTAPSRLATCNTGTGDAGYVNLEVAMLITAFEPTIDLSAAAGVDGELLTLGDATVLVSVEDLGVTPECEGSPAQRVTAGRDDGDAGGIVGNGLLEPGEVDDEDVRCVTESTGAPDFAYRTSGVAPGEVCELGGARLESGVDDDEDGVLGDDEVDEDRVLCVDPAPDDPGDEAEGDSGPGDAGVDSGGSDAGVDETPDAGTSDGGSGPDAADPDAGEAVDAEGEVDAEEETDTGEAPDRGDDTGQDGSVSDRDSDGDDRVDIGGEDAPRDASETGSSEEQQDETAQTNTDPSDGPGCDCTTAQSRHLPGAILLFLGLVLLRRRRLVVLD